MRPDINQPTIWDLRACLLSSLGFAEDFASNQPEHATAVAHFSDELRRIRRELMNLFQDPSTPSSSLHDIVNGLTGAKGIASIMAQRFPDKSPVLTKLEEDLARAGNELIQKVRPSDP
jgi:hypothetical protein